jgi:isopentenyldiphosphate isomerase
LSTCCSVPSMVGGTCNHVKQRAQYELVIALCFTAPSARRMKQ